MPPLTEIQTQSIVRQITAFYAEPNAEYLIAGLVEQPEDFGPNLRGEGAVEQFTKTFEYLTYAYFQENPMDLDRANTTVNAIRAGLTNDTVHADDQFNNFITQNINYIISIESLRGARDSYNAGSPNYIGAEEELRQYRDSVPEDIRSYVFEATSDTFMDEPIDELGLAVLRDSGQEDRADYEEALDGYVREIVQPDSLEQLRGFFANIDPGVLQQFLTDNKDLLIDAFMESDYASDSVDSFMGGEEYGWLATQETQIMTLMAQSDPRINYENFDVVLDPYIRDRIKSGNLPPDMYLLIHRDIKSWIGKVQYQNPDLTKREVADLVTDQRLDTLISNAVLDTISTQPGAAEFLEGLEASGHKVAGLILGRYEGEGYPTDFIDLYDFAEQLYTFGESVGIPKPAAPVDPERISGVVFYKQMLSSIFNGLPEDFVGSGEGSGRSVDGMSVYMRSKIINGMITRAGIEGFPDIINSENVGDLRAFFGSGMSRSIAEQVIRNELRAFGDLGQLLLDQLDDGFLIQNFMGLEIPRNTFTPDGFNSSMTGILSELYPSIPEPAEFDMDSALSGMVLPLIDGLPTDLQRRAVLAANSFMALQRDLYPEMDDEAILAMVGEDGGSFEDYVTFEVNETFSASFADDPLLQDLFEAAGGAVKFFRGVLPADSDVDFNVNTFFKTLPQHVRDLQEAGELEGLFEGIDPDSFGAAFDAEDERNAEAPEEAPEEAELDFSDTSQAAFILEQQRQRNERSAERGLFDPALEKYLRDTLGIGRAADVLRDFGDQFFDDYRRANPAIFWDKPSIQTPEDVEATEAREEADEAMFEAAGTLPEEEEAVDEEAVDEEEAARAARQEAFEEAATDASLEREDEFPYRVPEPEPGQETEGAFQEQRGVEPPVTPKAVMPEPEVPEPPVDIGPTPQELADIAAAQQAQLEENIQTSVRDFFPTEDLLSFARQSRTSRLRFFTSGARGGSRNTLARNIPLTQRGGR